MIARSEITDGIPSCGHFEKRGYSKKWTNHSMVSLPNCRHREKGGAYGRYKDRVAFRVCGGYEPGIKKNRDSLIFQKEYNLNTKPLEVDLLVIKKEASASIENEIGSFFRGHNIMEYKSPDDGLNIDVLYKAIAYAAFYKSYGKAVDARKADDITVTLVR